MEGRSRHEYESIPASGEGSGGGVPLPMDGGLGCHRGKSLKFEAQFGQSGAFWQEIDGSPVFHLCERKHCHNARQWYGIDTSGRLFLFFGNMTSLCFVM